MNIITRQCDYCQTDYQAQLRYLARGQGRFCTRKCSATFFALQRSPKPNLKCAVCATEIYRPKSKIEASKHKIFYCSQSCHNEGQTISNGLSLPSHYGASEHYRTLAFKHHPAKCRNCGWNKVPEILEVNHIDCDRSNNKLENLEILCPNCHAEYHFTTKTGKWALAR